MQAPELCTESSPCFAEATVVWWLPGRGGGPADGRGASFLRRRCERPTIGWQQLHDSPGLLKTTGLDDPSRFFVQCVSCTQSSCFYFFI